MEYDPLIAKLVVWDTDRDSAIARLRTALREYNVTGIRTTLDFFRDIIEDEEFRAARIDTGFIGRWMERRALRRTDEAERRIAVVGAGVHFLRTAGQCKAESGPRVSAWARSGRDALLR